MLLVVIVNNILNHLVSTMNPLIKIIFLYNEREFASLFMIEAKKKKNRLSKQLRNKNGIIIVPSRHIWMMRFNLIYIQVNT